VRFAYPQIYWKNREGGGRGGIGAVLGAKRVVVVTGGFKTDADPAAPQGITG
jgi:aldehyde:ferredoxin oxidoreductase